MASLIFRKDRNREGWLLSFYTADKKQRSIWLGESSKRNAHNVKRHVEELVRAQKANSRPEADSEAWAESTRGNLRESLVKFNLAKPEQVRPTDDASMYLGPFIDHYIEKRTDLKPMTVVMFKQVRSWAVAYFSERKPIASITQADFEQWLRWMTAEPTETELKSKSKVRKLAKSSATKHAKRLRQMLEFALRSRLVDENAGEGTRLGSEVNPSRQRFITRAMAADVLSKCPSIEWKLIFSLARFAGLRCPTEVLGLTWGDVDWDKGRLRIDSVKTGLRWCPLFPELRELLEQALEESPQKRKDAHVILSHRGNETNLRTQLLRIIKAAGLEAWPKLFNNLRASCRTELEERFPSHVIDGWLGHSSAVAKKHYLQITDDHWDRAAEMPAGKQVATTSGATAGATISAPLESATVGSESEKAQKTKPSVLAVPSEDSSKLGLYPREGSKSDAIPEEKQQSGQTAQLPAQLNSAESIFVVLADRLGRVLEVLATEPTITAAIAFAVGYGTREHTSPVVIPSSMLRSGADAEQFKDR